MINAQYIADHVALLKKSKSPVAKPSVTIIEELQAMVTEQNAVLQAQQVELDGYRDRDAMVRKQGGGAMIDAANLALAGVVPSSNLPPPQTSNTPTPVTPVPITPQVAFDIASERLGAIADVQTLTTNLKGVTTAWWDCASKTQVFEHAIALACEKLACRALPVVK